MLPQAEVAVVPEAVDRYRAAEAELAAAGEAGRAAPRWPICSASPTCRSTCYWPSAG